MDDGSGIGLIVAIIVCVGCGVIIGWTANNDTYHTEWCTERLAHAPTASDSLAVYQDDDFCLKVEK